MKKRREIFYLAGIFAFICLPVGAQEVKMEESLRRDVEFLSDTLCAGRASLTAGASEASMYLIRRFKSIGYTPEVQSFIGGRNVVAGALSARRKVLVMAYYDGLGTKRGKLYPGADSNSSGVAAMLALAESLKDSGLPLVFAAVDGHSDAAGSAALKENLPGVVRVVNLDILGGANPPIYRFWKDFLIILGGEGWRSSLEAANGGRPLHLYWDYFNSREFSELFFRRSGDHKPFLDAGVPCIMFSSGITMDTNRPTDGPENLDYPILARRVRFIASFIRGSYGKIPVSG